MCCLSICRTIELASDNYAGRLKEITDHLEQGVTDLFESDRYKEYLRVMARFHRYSFNNTLLIAMQCPGATRLEDCLQEMRHDTEQEEEYSSPVMARQG